ATSPGGAGGPGTAAAADPGARPTVSTTVATATPAQPRRAVDPPVIAVSLRVHLRSARVARTVAASGRHPAVLVTAVRRRHTAVRRRSAGRARPGPAVLRVGPVPDGRTARVSCTARRGGRSAPGDRCRIVAPWPRTRGGRRTAGLLAVVGVVHAVRLAHPGARSP